ncbi:MAG: antibiotic biosynthesis monooxygenase, partial [Desulfobacterales bacterium]
NNPKSLGRWQMIGLQILMHIPSTHRHELLQAFEIFSHKRENSPEHSGGCLNRNIFECIGTPDSYLWLENWTDLKSLEEYMKTDRFKALLGAIEVLGDLNAIHKGELSELAAV